MRSPGNKDWYTLVRVNLVTWLLQLKICLKNGGTTELYNKAWGGVENIYGKCIISITLLQPNKYIKNQWCYLCVHTAYICAENLFTTMCRNTLNAQSTCDLCQIFLIPCIYWKDHWYECTLHLCMKSILLTAGKGQSVLQNRALRSCFGFSWILKIVCSVFSIAELFLFYGFLFFFKVKSSKRNKRLKKLEQWSSTAFHKWLLTIPACIRTAQLCIVFPQTGTWKAWSLF